MLNLRYVKKQLNSKNYSRFFLKILLGFSGLLLIGISFVASCGFCLAIRIPFGPIHSSLPFLLMGLGVDDMFVILSYWYKIKDSIDSTMDFKEKIAYALSNAGASITVTTLTDIVAFIVGSSTVCTFF